MLLTLFYLGIFGASLLLSFMFTRYVRALATAYGWLAPPSTDRHLHNAPLPRLGGVAIFFAFVFTILTAMVLSWQFPQIKIGISVRTLATMLGPGLLIFLLGVYDDIRSVGPYFKFGIQVSAASILFFGGLRVLDLPVLFGNNHFPWFISLPLTILWVVAITNAFN